MYRTVQTHFAIWLALRHDECDDADAVPGHVERDFRPLECGILAHGFARALWAQCGHDFLIVFSCKVRGVFDAAAAFPRHRYLGSQMRTAAYGKFPWRPQLSEGGR